MEISVAGCAGLWSIVLLRILDFFSFSYFAPQAPINSPLTRFRLRDFFVCPQFDLLVYRVTSSLFPMSFRATGLPFFFSGTIAQGSNPLNGLVYGIAARPNRLFLWKTCTAAALSGKKVDPLSEGSQRAFDAAGTFPPGCTQRLLFSQTLSFQTPAMSRALLLS